MSDKGNLMDYHIIDMYIPKCDPEVLQVVFVDFDEGMDSPVYILTITYNVNYERQEPDYDTWDSEMDYYGYEQCDAEVIDMHINRCSEEADEDYGYSTGESVDHIDVNNVMGTNEWKEAREMIEENYSDYMRELLRR